MKASVHLVTTVIGATILAVVFAANLMGQQAGLKELRFTVDEVTETDVSAIPNDGGIVFTLLGDLYRLPVTGGDAVQITTGPYFHKEPAVSPDGKWIAVVSNRDPRRGDNIYLLDMSGGSVRLVSNEPEAGRPSWSPDGKRIVFLAYKRPQPVADFYVFPREPALIKEFDLETGEIKNVTDQYQPIRDVTFGRSGELYWIRLEDREDCSRCTESQIRKRSLEGEVATEATLDGIADQLRISKSGFFYSYIPRNTQTTIIAYETNLRGNGRAISRGDMRQFGTTARRFAINDQGSSLYTFSWGSLWSVDLRDGLKSRLPFRADVVRTTYSPAPPPKYVAPEESETFELGIVADPVLRPDGKELAFSAAGSIWLLSLDSPGAEPRRLTMGITMDPAYSPDGKKIAFARRTGPRKAELVVVEYPKESEKVLAAGSVAGPSWAPDGDRIVYRDGWGLKIASLSDGKITSIQKRSAWYVPRFSDDGASVIAHRKNRMIDDRFLVRFSLSDPQKETRLTDIKDHMNDPVVSPNGKWLAFGRNGDLWIANLTEALKDDGVVSDDEAELFEREAGLSFSFDPRPGSQTLIYGKDRRIFRAELPGGNRTPVAGPFSLPAATQKPTVIRNVRVLSKEGTSFSEPTTIYVDGARIVAIGAEPDGFNLKKALVVEGRGRFAIPGLWDSHLHGRVSGDMKGRVDRGVTSHRDMGSEIVDAVQEMDRYRAFESAGPRRFYSGEIFEGFDDNWWGRWNRISDVETARALTTHWKKLGVRFVKAYSTLPWPLMFEVSMAARDNQLPLSGHGGFYDQAVRSIILGFRSLEHQGPEYLQREDLWKLIAASDTFVCPTAVSATDVEGILMLRDPEGRANLLSDSGESEQAAVRVRLITSPGLLLGSWRLYSEQLRRADQLGVRLMIGTDNFGGPGGFNSELEAFQDAGIPAGKILRMATLYPAMAEGVEEDLGTLEVGKLADLILLDKDPLENVANLRNPSFVIRGGRLIHKRDDQDAPTKNR